MEARLALQGWRQRFPTRSGMAGKTDSKAVWPDIPGWMRANVKLV